jgi:hypothetical protein
LGYQALNSNTGTYNIAVGYQAAQAMTSGTYNIAIGYNSMNNPVTGSHNVGVGYATGAYLTSGQYNTAIGDSALYSNTTASNNTAVGYQAGYAVTTGSPNTFLGYQAGKAVTTGTDNIAIGQALATNTTGNSNVAIGDGALNSTTGSSNTAVGAGAGYSISSGSLNTILGGYSGNQGGLDIRSSSNNVVLSDGAGNPAAYRSGSNNAWYFGNGGTSSTYDGVAFLNGAASTGRGAALVGLSNGSSAWSAGSYSFVVSGTSSFFAVSNTSGGVYLNGASATSWTAVSSDVREKKDFAPVEGLTQLLQVVPTKYRYIWEDESHPIHMGFTAQNIQPLIPDMVVTRDEKAEDGTNLLTVTMDHMIPVLVQSVKDLNAIVTAQATEIAALKTKVGI